MCYCVLFVTSTRRRRLGAQGLPAAAGPHHACHMRARRQRLLLRAYVSKNRCSRQEDRNELGMQAFLTATALRRMQAGAMGLMIVQARPRR